MIKRRWQPCGYQKADKCKNKEARNKVWLPNMLGTLLPFTSLHLLVDIQAKINVQMD